MGIIWSWAFGEETWVKLLSLGFSVDTPDKIGNDDYYMVDNAFTYGYPGEPSGRSSIRVRNDKKWYPPALVSPQGAISIAFKATDNLSDSTNQKLFEVDTGSKSFGIECTGGNNVRLTMGDDDGADFGITLNVWHWLTVKYDVRSSSDYKGKVYLDGVQIPGEVRDTSADSVSADLVIGFEGIAGEATVLGSDANTWFGAIVFYDDAYDTGTSEVPRFVTRIQPTNLTGSAGAWSAVNAPTILDAVTGSQINSSSYAHNTTIIVGDHLNFEAGTTIDAQLGISASYVDGVTMHFVASGSGPFGQAQLSDNPSGSWATGSNLMLTAESGYGYGSAATRPQAGGAWSGSSDLYLKYEAS